MNWIWRPIASRDILPSGEIIKKEMRRLTELWERYVEFSYVIVSDDYGELWFNYKDVGEAQRIWVTSGDYTVGELLANAQS